MIDKTTYIEKHNKKDPGDGRVYMVPISAEATFVAAVRAKSLTDAMVFLSEKMAEGFQPVTHDVVESAPAVPVNDLLYAASLQEADWFDPREILSGTPEVWETVVNERQRVMISTQQIGNHEVIAVFQNPNAYDGDMVRYLAFLDAHDNRRMRGISATSTYFVEFDDKHDIVFVPVELAGDKQEEGGPRFDAILLEVESGVTTDDMRLLVNGSDEDTEYECVRIDGDYSSVYGIMESETFDNLVLTNAMESFAGKVREVLNDMDLESQTGEYVFAGIKTFLGRRELFEAVFGGEE